MNVTLDTGNFSIEVSGEYSEEAKADALKNALKYELQRDVITKAYIALVGVKGKRDAMVLPEGFERDSVGFSAEAANALASGAKAALAKRGSFDVKVKEYVGSEAATPMKRASAFVDALLDGGAKESQMRTLFATLGMADARAASRDALVKFANEKGLGIQPAKA